MPAGTIALTNNSAAVTGTGTSFTSELKANDFVVVVVGGVTYTLGIKSVDSATALTLVSAYGGATTSGLSWTPVPNATLVGITAQVAADVAKAIRGLNLDKANWQQIFTGTGNVTVNLPDGTSFTGPAWNGIALSISGKMDKSQNLNDLSDKSKSRENLGLKNSATRDVGTTSGTVAAGNDSRFVTIDGKTGGGVTGDVFAIRPTGSYGPGPALSSVVYPPGASVASVQWQMFSEVTASGRYGHLRLWQDAGFKDWYFDYGSGNAYAPATWQANSDERIKEKIARIENPLEKMKLIKGCTWTRKDDGQKGAFGIGFIAQEVKKVFPGAVSVGATGSLIVGGEVVEDPLALDAGSVAAALHHEAILALMDKIEQQDAVIEELQNRMKAIDGLNA